MRWTPEDDALLTKFKIEGLELNDIALRMGRTSGSIDSRWHSIRSKTDPLLKPRKYVRKE